MEKIAVKINEEIKESNLYKEYLLLKEKVENDKYLSNLKETMENLKQNICKSKDEELTASFYEVEREYKNNPLVKDYLLVKEELNVLLKDIADILSLN